MHVYQGADASTFEALMTVASGLHGPESQSPGTQTVRLPGGMLDRLADPEDATHFLSTTAAWWREHSDTIDWRTPRGRIDRPTLARLRHLRDAVQALANGDRKGYERLLKQLADHYAFRLDVPTGGLRATINGWDGFAGNLLLALAELGERADRVRRCANPRCQWVLLDLTKNGSRTWCHGTLCGNKFRVRRWRARQARATARGRKASPST